MATVETCKQWKHENNNDSGMDNGGNNDGGDSGNNGDSGTPDNGE